MQRVAIVGSGGAGKSVLAKRLGDATGLPVYHLDRFYWQPGWVRTPSDEWREIQAELIERPAWILDGNFRATIEMRFKAADTVVFLDYPPLLCVWGVVKRFLRYPYRSRPDMAAGNPELLNLAFLRWVYRYPQTDRPEVIERLESLGPGTRIVRLRNRREANDFLETARRERLQLRPPLAD